MMNNLFLDRSAPLYGRAHKLLHVEPMSYAAFCRACRLNPKHPESFTRYAMVGGIPKYWEFVERNQSALELAETLYFGFAPYLDEEPSRILRDEGFSGLTALSVLEAIGRGAAKPSEIAARLGTAQTNLSRVFQQLLDVSIIERELPYGESVRTTKRTQYRICDPVLRFWFQIYSPHRTRWRDYSTDHRNSLLHLHASTIFEDYCRELLGGAARYWEGGDLEFDAVRSEGVGRQSTLLVSEVKWMRLTPSERAARLRQLEARWGRTKLCHRFSRVKCSVIDSSILQRATLSD